MPLPAWVLVVVFAPSTLIFGYIVYRWERSLFPVVILPLCMMILYGWIAVTSPEPQQIPITAWYSFLFVTSFLDYVAIERWRQWAKGERSGV